MIQIHTKREKRKLLLLDVIDKLHTDAGNAEVTTEALKQFLSPEKRIGPTLNQALYAGLRDKHVKKHKINARLSFYTLTAQGKKYLEANRVELEKIKQQPLEDLWYFKAEEPKKSAPGIEKSTPDIDVPVSQSAAHAVDSIGALIDENRRLHGLLLRFHAELGRALGIKNQSDNSKH